MKPTICMVSNKGCIRVFKEAYALKKLGYKVHHCAMIRAYGFNAYDTFHVYNNWTDGVRLIEFMDKAGIDIFHVHNEPDWIVSMTRAGTKKPIVYDVHDLEHLRHTLGPLEEESRAFIDCDAVVHTTLATKASAEKHHGAKPCAVIPPALPADFLCDDDTAERFCPNTLVYEGGLWNEKFSWSPGEKIYRPNYRYLADLIEPFANLGYRAFFHSADRISAREYEQLGAVVYPSLPWDVLLRALPLYELGFVGATVNNALMQKSMPNKLFEYMASGVVPVISMCHEALKFANEWDVGIDLDPGVPLNEMITPDVIKEKRENLLKGRREIVMERYIGRLEGLYKSLL